MERADKLMKDFDTGFEHQEFDAPLSIDNWHTDFDRMREEMERDFHENRNAIFGTGYSALENDKEPVKKGEEIHEKRDV